MRLLNRPAWAVLALALLLGGSSPARADFIPTGIQTNVSYNTVVNDWGWSVLYQGGYGVFTTQNAVFAGAGEYLMLAAMQNGTGNIALLAAAKTSDVLQGTDFNTTHEANGTLWYRNGSSMGFSPLGSTISQNSADTNNAPGFANFDPNIGALKLSWHTSQGNGTYLDPEFLNGGWRAGNETFLNGEPSGWTRIVFTLTPSVPEPATLAVFGMMALGGAGYLRRRKVAPTA